MTDAPYAFVETLAEAEATPDSVWQDRVRQNSEGKNSICALASEEGHLLGMTVGLCNPDSNNEAHLVAMWVSPEQRGTGTAEALVEFIANWARESGAVALLAGVMEDNPPTLTFYRKIGFELVSNPHSKKPDPTGNKILLKLIIH